MFAGAAREAVFSDPDVAAIINNEFIPVALKAGEVNRPDESPLGKYYGEIRRSMPQPQGIAVANPFGKVLAWTLGFDTAEEIPQFLEHTLKRFRESPDATGPVPVERFHRFPGRRFPVVADTRPELPSLAELKEGRKKSPAAQPVGLECRLVVRALGDDGAPAADTLHQESYAEDRLSIPARFETGLVDAVEEAMGEVFKLPPQFARALVGAAYLGKLDVAPLGGPAIGGEVVREHIELWGKAETPPSGDGSLVRIAGASKVAGQQGARRRAEVRWSNNVDLQWEGVVLIRGGRVDDLAITGTGSVALSWHGFSGEPVNDTNIVAHLMAGRPIEFKGPVKFAILPVEEK